MSQGNIPPTANFDEEAALEQVLAMSLLTAKEDEERRQRLYGDPTDQPVTNRGSKPDASIARPRPTSKGSAPPRPTIPPRPHSGNQPQFGGAPPPLPTSGPNTGTLTRQDPPNKTVPPRPAPRRSLDKVRCQPDVTDTPLMSFSPSSTNNQDPFNFDLSTLDPLNCSKRNETRDTFSGYDPWAPSKSSASSKPSVSDAPVVMRHGAIKTPHDSRQSPQNLRQSPQHLGQSPQNSRQSSNFTDRQLSNWDAQSVASNWDTQSVASSFDSVRSVPPEKWEPLRFPQQHPRMGYASSVASMSSTLSGYAAGGVTRPPPPQGVVMFNPMFGRDSITGQADTGAPVSAFTRPPSQGLQPPTNVAQRSISHESQTLPRVGSTGNMEIRKCQNGSVPTGIPRASSDRALSSKAKSPTPTTSRPDSDLMDFSGNDVENLTLESFDPLFTMNKLEESSVMLESCVFSNPNDQYERKETPNPFPHINANTTQVILKKSSIQYDEPEDENKDTASAGSPSKSHKRQESLVEIQDPFSVQELSVNLAKLEEKRIKHMKEAEERKAVLKQEEREREEKERESNRDVRAGKLSRRESKMGFNSAYEALSEYQEFAVDEAGAFCDMVARVKMNHPYSDDCNTGLILSPRIPHRAYKDDMTVKVRVFARFMKEPLTFTPALSTMVEMVICEVILSITDNLQSTTAADYVIKVFGKSEFFLNNTSIGEYTYVHECLKLDEDIKLVIEDLNFVSQDLLRIATDDHQPVLVPKQREVMDESGKVTREKLNILTETFYREVERLRDSAIANGCTRVHCKGVIQAVKAICVVLCKIETVDIIKACKRLLGVTINKGLQRGSSSDRDAFMYVNDDGEAVYNVKDVDSGQRVSEPYADLSDLHIALDELTKSVKSLIEMYCKTFHTDFRFQSATASEQTREKRHITDIGENLIVHIATVHRIPQKLRAAFEEFRIYTSVAYAGRRLAAETPTNIKPMAADGLGETLVWDEWIIFQDITLNMLPRETRMLFTLVGIRTVPATNNEQTHKVYSPLGGAVMQLFNHKFELVQGSQLLGLWPKDPADPVGTNINNTDTQHSILLQVNMPDFGFGVIFQSVPDTQLRRRQDFHSLHPTDQANLNTIIEKDPMTTLHRDEADFLWSKRFYLCDNARALCKVLQASPVWDYSSLCDIYPMVQEWCPLEPVIAFELLLPTVVDTFVRAKAVEYISTLSSDELLDYVPQLIQALKFESYHTNSLTKLLLERAACSLRIAHQLYWQLKEAADDARWRKRYQLVFGGLLSCVGESVRKEFSKQEDLVRMLGSIAEKVKASKDKEHVLQVELSNMWDYMNCKTVRLPLNPAYEVNGVDVKSCSFFSSNAFPLKLVMKNVEANADNIYIMFKAGDDIRQDMLTMQLIGIMDRLWLENNLDLRIITFRTQHTGLRKGLIELVTESETLRKIQIKHGHGLAGSFKDTTIRDWLQTQNPTELEYEKAVDNFTGSCAGYCVATYILGICDRHNDNIMVKQSGHMFHIDFGKFLGDAQMIGNFKRDRSPFVLTSDMAYVINGGDKPTQRFQIFIDLCCRAFNIIRRHGDLLLNLFALMKESGIPGVNANALKYVQMALLPDHTDIEATAAFTRMIEESLKSTFTQINFFFHNLAQIKFSGHAEGALLSFIPKTYSLQTDGRIISVEIFGYQKRYNPEKFYIYIIKVVRENQKVPSFIFRRYSEFQELHQKLVSLFPLVQLPSLTSKVILGRTHVNTVASHRKVELEEFLRGLLSLSPEISEHDLVYTFFHPMLRDEQDIDKTNLQKLKEPTPPRVSTRTIEGEIKLSVFYKNDALTVMVMHVKDLCGQGGDPPDPYVKLYLLPDPLKVTKQKTKIAKSTFHPTYNEMLTYRLPLEDIKLRVLQVSVWSYDSLKENEFLGAVILPLHMFDLSKETTQWYKLERLHHMTSAAKA